MQRPSVADFLRTQGRRVVGHERPIYETRPRFAELVSLSYDFRQRKYFAPIEKKRKEREQERLEKARHASDR